MAGRAFVRREDFVNSTLWQHLPVINVDKCDDIPCDWPGLMGVPITFLDKFSPNQFQIYDLTNHIKLENGREPYRRIIVRNLQPILPELIDITELFALVGVPVDFMPVSKVLLGVKIAPEYRLSPQQRSLLDESVGTNDKEGI